MTVPKIVGIVVCSFLFGNSFSQNVGINTTTPAYPLDVNGDVRASANVYINGKLGFGTTTPMHNIHMVDGSMGFTSSIDNVTWVFSYSSASDFLFIAEDNDVRAVMKRGGNVGIGTQAPSAKLHVNGSFKANSVVVGNNGIMLNSAGTSALKYASKSVTTATGALAAFGISDEISLTFPAGVTYSEVPKAFVGNITSTSITTGSPYHVQVVLYGATTTGCKVRLVNTSPDPVNLSLTWNLVSTGE